MSRFTSLLSVVVFAVALIGCGDSDASATASPSPSATIAAAADPETIETLGLVVDRTEELFDLDGGDGPEISLIDSDELGELLTELLEDPEVVESLRRDEAFYSLFGLIAPGTDLIELNEELLGTGVAGLYRPEIDHLYVRLFGSFSALEESTASHEYAHYLQDAGYDLEAMFEVVAGDRDAELALRALVEGDAQYVQQLYVAEYFNAAQVFSMGVGGLAAVADGGSAPYVFTRETTFVYLDGQAWIDAQLGRGFGRATLYTEPPRTTREILHPETYADGAADTVAIGVVPEELPDGWTVQTPETIGELVLTTWLEELGGRGTGIATEGWIADGLRVFHEDGEPVAFMARVWWETPEDVNEFLESAEAALDRDSRYAPVECSGCPYATWEGPAGVLALYTANSVTQETHLAVAPSIDELKQLFDAVR